MRVDDESAAAVLNRLRRAQGQLAGVIAMVALAIRKEDRLRSLTRQPPSAATRGARRLNGVGLRDITPWEMPR